ncbi:unnamed protein product [Urochloa humidicola]
MVRAAAVAVLLLMQCCSVTLAARPLLPAAAGDGGWQLRQGILQSLDKSSVPTQPGQGNNCDWMGHEHPKGSCPPPPNTPK